MKLTTALTTIALGVAACAADAQLGIQSIGIFDDPVFVTHAGDGSGRLFIVEQDGAIRIIDDNGTTLPVPFIDIDPRVLSGGEQGLLGLAFHPKYTANGKYYVNYTTNDGGRVTRISEFIDPDVTDNVGDETTERVLLQFSQPFSNHNGGWIGFGPDGYLYISTGDGGSAGDPGNRAADLGELLGKMLRIDVDEQDQGLEYGIPDGNPWADDGDASTRAEIYHYGLRNAWRCAFDRDTGDLWMADVGQNAREEVNHNIGNTPGVFYGWRCREGNIAFSSCGVTGWVDPVHWYAHNQGCSITGGYVYRGCELGEDYQGLYFFSDYCNGQVWTLDPDNAYALNFEFSGGFGIVSYGEDEDGELYLCRGNTVYKFVNPGAADDDNDGVPDACQSACAADFNGNGVTDFPDVGQFLTLFAAGDLQADLNGDGSVSFPDVSAFLGQFVAGCP